MRPLKIETKKTTSFYRVKSDFLKNIEEPLLFECSLFKSKSSSGKEIRFLSFYESFFIISKVL